jgi:hypothetical protein
LIQEAFYKSLAQSAIAEAQVNAGDLPGAQSTLAAAQISTKAPATGAHNPASSKLPTPIAMNLA